MLKSPYFPNCYGQISHSQALLTQPEVRKSTFILSSMWGVERGKKCHKYQLHAAKKFSFQLPNQPCLTFKVDVGLRKQTGLHIICKSCIRGLAPECGNLRKMHIFLPLLFRDTAEMETESHINISLIRKQNLAAHKRNTVKFSGVNFRNARMGQYLEIYQHNIFVTHKILSAFTKRQKKHRISWETGYGHKVVSHIGTQVQIING